jgi:hypothetical protein
MSPSEKVSYNLLINYLFIVFFFVMLYTIVSLLTSSKMTCGCGTNCKSQNISCPCYRKIIQKSYDKNEY